MKPSKWKHSRHLLPSFICSDYFDDYGQNQISSIQFSPDGLYLAIVTDDRWVFQRRYLRNVSLERSNPHSMMLRWQGSSHLGARNERDGHADQSGPAIQRTVLQLSSTRGSRCHGVTTFPSGVSGLLWKMLSTKMLSFIQMDHLEH